MNVRHADATLQKIDEDPDETGGYAEAIVTAFRRKMQFIRAALNETDFYQMKSLHFEKLKGNRSHQYSMRLNKQYRLILEIEKGRGENRNTVVVRGIEDYH